MELDPTISSSILIYVATKKQIIFLCIVFKWNMNPVVDTAVYLCLTLYVVWAFLISQFCFGCCQEDRVKGKSTV